MSVRRFFQRGADRIWTEALDRLRPEILSPRRRFIPRDLLRLLMMSFLYRLAAPHEFKRLRTCWYGFNFYSFGPGTIGEPPLSLNC